MGGQGGDRASPAGSCGCGRAWALTLRDLGALEGCPQSRDLPDSVPTGRPLAAAGRLGRPDHVWHRKPRVEGTVLV